jgi:hypothetical protein
VPDPEEKELTKEQEILGKLITGRLFLAAQDDSVDKLLGILEAHYERQTQQLRQIRARFKQMRRPSLNLVSNQTVVKHFQATGKSVQLIKRQHLMEQLDGDEGLIL